VVVSRVLIVHTGKFLKVAAKNKPLLGVCRTVFGVLKMKNSFTT
jgi:hypothetical protein